MDKVSDQDKQSCVKSKNRNSISENLMIPKHRFDYVNNCLKETKQSLKEKISEIEISKVLIIKLKEALLDSKMETVLAQHGAKNLTAVKALIKLSNLKLEQDGNVPGLEAEVLRIKESQSYLFEGQEETAYVLVPIKDSNQINKFIKNKK